MFDLRSLEHSTILYEAGPAPSSSSSSAGGGAGASGASATSPPPSTTPAPLLRLAFSPTSPTYVAVVHADSADVQILDTRNPGAPAFEVRGHRAAVNGLAWGGGVGQGQGGETSGPGWLATVGASALALSLSPRRSLSSDRADSMGASRAQATTPTCSCGTCRTRNRLNRRLGRSRSSPRCSARRRWPTRRRARSMWWRGAAAATGSRWAAAGRRGWCGASLSLSLSLSLWPSSCELVADGCARCHAGSEAVEGGGRV